jgi:uncharacterized protein (TIGR00303 family)
MPSLSQSLIRVHHQGAIADKLLCQWRGQLPAFVCVLGFTHTGLIDNISAAGLTSRDRQFTAIADGEFLATGQTYTVPLPPLTQGVSPALITRAILTGLNLRPYIANAGLPMTPPIPECLDLGGMPAQCLTTGKALPLAIVHHIFQSAYQWGKTLRTNYAYVTIGECVVGGTTTALAVLQALGISAHGKVGSSHRICNHDQKWHIVQQGLAQLPPHPDPWSIVSVVGDPMQIAVAGLTLAIAQHKGVLLAGGSQMVAVYALARSIAGATGLPWHKENILIGTTKWATNDSSSGLVQLAQLVDAPLVSSQFSLANSQYPQLRSYEAGYVKEGVGAGAVCILAHLYANWDQAQMLAWIEALLAKMEYKMDNISTIYS